MKLIFFLRSRRKIVERYLAMRRENKSLHKKVAMLEEQVALYKKAIVDKLKDIDDRRKNIQK